jgi:hypothetical protein
MIHQEAATKFHGERVILQEAPKPPLPPVHPRFVVAPK